MRKIALLSVIFFTFAQLSYAEDNIIVEDAWVREAPPGSSVSAAYMTIENKGKSDKLVGMSSEIAESVELHTTKVDENSVATMEMIKVLEVPTDKSIQLEPGGMHIMLIGLKESLVGKDEVDLKLVFENAGEIEVKVPVKKSVHEGHHHNH